MKTRRRLRQVRYASVNKRVRSLEGSGYIEKIGFKETKAGFKAAMYRLTVRTYLAILFNSVNLNELVMLVDEATALAILGEIIHIYSHLT